MSEDPSSRTSNTPARSLLYSDSVPARPAVTSPLAAPTLPAHCLSRNRHGWQPDRPPCVRSASLPCGQAALQVRRAGPRVCWSGRMLSEPRAARARQASTGGVRGRAGGFVCAGRRGRAPRPLMLVKRKGRSGRHQQNILCESPLTSLSGAGSCDSDVLRDSDHNCPSHGSSLGIATVSQ